MDSIRSAASSAGSIQDYLQGIDFPITKDQLIDAVQRNGAPADIVDRVRGLAPDRFASAQDVLTALRGI